jgi:hypothetical protein
MNGFGVAHVGVIIEDANDVTTGSLHDPCTDGEGHISDLMTVNASNVNACACNVMKFTDIGSTDATISAAIDKSTGLTNVIMQGDMIVDVGHVNTVLGRYHTSRITWW